jgi:hypothetical protein
LDRPTGGPMPGRCRQSMIVVMAALSIAGCKSPAMPLVSHLAPSGSSTMPPSSASPASVGKTDAHVEPGLRLLGIALPTSGTRLIARLGEPTSIDLPSKESLDLTPDGQWFRWRLASRGLVLSALNEEYSRSVRPESPVSYIQVVWDGRGQAAKLAFGFRLNRTRKIDVRRSVGNALQQCTGRFGREGALKTRDGKSWWFFFFTGDRLTGMGQGLFDLDNSG